MLPADAEALDARQLLSELEAEGVGLEPGMDVREAEDELRVLPRDSVGEGLLRRVRAAGEALGRELERRERVQRLRRALRRRFTPGGGREP